ncbi:MAG: hypothetical protein ACXWDL_04525 [Nocardioides sp.]
MRFASCVLPSFREALNSMSREQSLKESVEGTSVEPATSPLLSIEGTFEIPEGEDGALSVVVTGEADAASGTVPVVVRNMTASPLANIEVSGTARDGAGEVSGPS